MPAFLRGIWVATLYWVAITHRKDQWHPAAVQASRALAGCYLVTTDEVLTEVLAAFGEAGTILRQRAAALVRRLHQRPTVTVRLQSRATFLSGLARYEARPDKGYSLTDGISMATMRQEGISEVLTQASHFPQEGFTVLLGARDHCHPMPAHRCTIGKVREDDQGGWSGTFTKWSGTFTIL